MQNGTVTFNGSNAAAVASTLDIYVYPHPTQSALILYAYQGAPNPLGVLGNGQTATVTGGNTLTITGTAVSGGNSPGGVGVGTSPLFPGDADSRYIRVVMHGATANTARPAGAVRVYWLGSVSPTNAVQYDRWVDISATAVVEKINTAATGQTWQILGGSGGTTTTTVGAVVHDLASGTPSARDDVNLALSNVASNPFLTVSQSGQPLGSIQWPSVLYVGDIFGTATLPAPGPYGEYWRCYYSTDHANASGSGIALATNSSLTPEDGTAWVMQGDVFHDTTGAGEFQTETAHVIYVPDAIVAGVVTPSWYMYYHRLLGSDGTAGEVVKLATMPVSASLQDTFGGTGGNGVQANGATSRWTIHSANGGEVMDNQRDAVTAWPNPPLYGYGRVGRRGNDFFMHVLIGGVPQTAFGLAWSQTGLPGTWRLDSRPLYCQANMLNDPLGRFNATSHQFAWNSVQVVRVRGQLCVIGNVMSNNSGAGTPSFTMPCIAPVSQDLRRLLAVPVPLLSTRQSYVTSGMPTGAVEGMLDGRGASTLVVTPDGKYRFFYQSLGGIHPVTNPQIGGSKATAGAFALAVSA